MKIQNELRAMAMYLFISAICVVIKFLFPDFDYVALIAGAALAMASRAYFKEK